MVTLLYHSKAVGWVTDRIAAQSDGKIQSICDKTIEEGSFIEGRVIHWDSRKDVRGDEVVNSPEAVKLSRNKKKTRKILDELAPLTLFTLKDIQDSFFAPYPIVIRPGRHYGGNNFFLCNDIREVKIAIKKCKNWYATEFIDKDREYRVFIYKGEPIKVVRRLPPENDGDIWNANQGGSSVRVKVASWPRKVVELAVIAAKRIGLGWAAVDIITVDDYGQWVLELNTAPGIHRESTQRQFARVFTND
jgi:glutathione synthase/RimK-type ligase-like ATP-grasp enzyme